MSTENGQVTFNQEIPYDNQKEILHNRVSITEESLFNAITNYYSSKNIQVQKIDSQEFSELLNSNPEFKKIINEYEEKLDDDTSNSIKGNIFFGPVKFIIRNDGKEEDFPYFFYEGEFNKEGKINGKGTKIINDKIIYKGEFTNGEYNGKGLLIKNGGSIFGNWIKGICSGKVIYKKEGEFEYKGNFENNKKNGYGIETYKDGSKYEGNFVNNKKSGKGIYRFANGEMYEGNFENNLYNGEGKYLWGLDRRKYEGEFKNGIISGKGVFTYNDGAIYHGYFENGEKNGEGFIEFPDGKKYYGNWLNNELYGNGYLVNGNEKTEVVFRHGKIISSTIDIDKDSNYNNVDLSFNNNNYGKFKIECFMGNTNNINVNKYICPICNCFLCYPLKCSECSTNFCKECVKEENCKACNANKFESNEKLIEEMTENVKIQCNKCEQILDYKDSLKHIH
jgi:hypothetical protein